MNTKMIIDDIDELFGDTSVAVATTRDNLEDIKQHIEMLLDTLPEED